MKDQERLRFTQVFVTWEQAEDEMGKKPEPFEEYIPVRPKCAAVTCLLHM